MALDDIEDKKDEDVTLSEVNEENQDVSQGENAQGSDAVILDNNIETASEDEEDEPFSLKQELISWAQTIVFAVILAFVVNSFLVVNAKVPTGSMENTVMTGDRILAWRGSYWFSDPEKGDIIVFKYPDDPTGETLYLKRIIGTSGDTVYIQDGDVYVNDIVIDEPYIKDMTFGNFGPYTVPDGHSFVMGDNRNSSEDSRYWQNTYVEDNEILGKVVFRYFKEFAWLW